MSGGGLDGAPGDGPPPIHDGALQVDADGTPTLQGGRCPSCGTTSFPAAATCPQCGAEAVEQTALSRTGTLWGWTAVTAAPPGYTGPVPFGFGVVELPDGVRVVTRLTEADPSALAFGQAMALAVEIVPTGGGDRLTWTFAPAEPGGGR